MAILVESIEQLALNAVRMTFTEQPKRFNSNDLADSLNTENYYITTGDMRVQWVSPGDDVFSVVVFFDRGLTPNVETFFEVQRVEEVSGASVVPDTATPITPFGEEMPPLPEQSLRGRFDIANPQTVRDANGGPLGTFQVTESGDLANDTGRTNLRKRVFRRISTRPGGFFHLQDYGVKVGSKTLLTPTLLRELQINLQSQILREPDVVGARITVSEMAPGVVRVKVRVQDALGAFELDAALDITGDSDA